VEFLAGPPPLGRLMDVKVEHVPVLDLVAIRGDVVGGLSELARDAELAKAGFLGLALRVHQNLVPRGARCPVAAAKRWVDDQSARGASPTIGARPADAVDRAEGPTGGRAGPKESNARQRYSTGAETSNDMHH
jgi:hypothetical protein